MTTTLNLDALAAEFSAWCQHKNGPGQDPTTPNELKQIAAFVSSQCLFQRL